MADRTYTKQDLQALARQAARDQGLDEALFLGQIDVETGGTWNPRSVGPKTRFGTAKGLGQLIDDTATRFGVKDVFDPVQNLRASAKYMKWLVDRYGDYGLALAGYNWGERNVDNMLNNPARFTPPKETANYVPEAFKRANFYGDAPAPTTPTLAFFPGTTDAVKLGIQGKVARKTGTAARDIRDVENAIQTGQTGGTPPIPVRGTSARGDEFVPPIGGPGGGMPTGGGAGPTPTGPGPAAPPIGAAAAQGQAVDAAAMREIPGPQQLIRQTENAPKAKTLDGYLRRQFGPIADFADPFPKAFDEQLMRVINEA